MNIEYINKLKNELKLDPQFPSLSSKETNTFTCLLCNNVFSALPKAKMQSFVKFGLSGCPKCTLKQKYKMEDEKNIKQMLQMGYELHSSYNGYKNDIDVSNMRCCNRVWTTKPKHILSGRSFCKPCNDESKATRIIDYNNR